MWPLAGTMIGLIGLIAFDDVRERRPARHTWLASFRLVGGIAVVMLATIGAGQLLA